VLEIKIVEKPDYIDCNFKDKESTLLENLTAINGLVNNLKDNYDLSFDDIQGYINWYNKHLKEVSEK
jgi:hypothetical protein